MATDLRVQNYIDENGTIGDNIKSVTGNVTLTAADTFVEANGTMTITLPAISGLNTGKMYYIKNIGTGVVTVDPNASETIDDETTQTLYQDSCMVIINTGTEWRIV
jgi:hypothetical protein